MGEAVSRPKIKAGRVRTRELTGEVDSKPVDELAPLYARIVRALDGCKDDDDLAELYERRVPLPDGRVVPVGDWTTSHLVVVRARAAGVRR